MRRVSQHAQSSELLACSTLKKVSSCMTESTPVDILLVQQAHIQVLTQSIRHEEATCRGVFQRLIQQPDRTRVAWCYKSCWKTSDMLVWSSKYDDFGDKGHPSCQRSTHCSTEGNVLCLHDSALFTEQMLHFTACVLHRLSSRLWESHLRVEAVTAVSLGNTWHHCPSILLLCNACHSS